MTRRVTLPSNFHKDDYVKLMKTEQNGRLKLRYLAMSYLAQGKQIKEVCALLYVKPKTVHEWLKLVKQEGSAGLQDKPGRGRKSKLDPSLESTFKNRIIQAQQDRVGGRINGKDIKNLLKEEYQIDCCIASVYNLLKRVNLVWISGRTEHPNVDRTEQETFKKTLPK